MSSDLTSDLAEALGASRVVDLGSDGAAGPLDLLSLRHEVGERLRSTGGRPTDPNWTMTRQVPFARSRWERLQQLADQVGDDRRVAASQLAAIFVERGMDEWEADQWPEVLAISRQRPPMTGREAADAAGVTYRQLDDWCKQGLIEPVTTDGRQRWFDDDAVVVAVAIRRLYADERNIVAVPSRDDLTARYLLATDDGVLRGLWSLREVSLALSQSEGASVVDQLPVRRRLIGPAGPDGEGGFGSGPSAKAV